MEINAKLLMCTSIVPLQFLARLQVYCLFQRSFRDLATEQGELGIRAQEEGKERTFWEIVSVELRRACCVAVLKQITCFPVIIQMGTQSFVEIALLSLQKYSSSQKPAQVEDK